MTFLIGGLLLFACGSESSEFDFERTRLYASVDQVVDDSALVIGGIVRSVDEVDEIEGMRFPIATVEVSEVVKSDREIELGETLRVRQTDVGSGGMLEPGERVILALSPFRWTLDGPETGQWTVTGIDFGLFYDLGGGRARSAVDSTEFDDFPTEVEIDSIRAATKD